MADRAWIDELQRSMARREPRRTIVRRLVMLVALGGAAPDLASAKKPTRKPKRKRCGKAKCKAEFTTPQDIRYCQIMCGRCKRAGRQFCIVEGDPFNPAKVAVCCAKGGKCFGEICCGKGLTGCDYPPSDSLARQYCADLQTSDQNCGRCGRACNPDESCVNGRCRRRGATCPPQTIPCGGPSAAEPAECCDQSACFACLGNGAGEASCTYACTADEICQPTEDIRIGATCCWPAGRPCNPNNPSQVGHCCSRECVRQGDSNNFACA